jgi:hypothetical protein
VNTELLVSDAAHFRIDYEINPYMHTEVQPDPEAAATEHAAIVVAPGGGPRRVHAAPPNSPRVAAESAAPC